MGWAEAEPIMRERAYRTLDSDPQSLLECDGGPVGQTADVILARLVGFDDEIVGDIRLQRVEPVWLVPIYERVTLVEAAPCPTRMRTARYVLQSGYVRMQLAPEHAPPDTTPGPPAFTVSLLFLRYRRRL